MTLKTRIRSYSKTRSWKIRPSDRSCDFLL